MLYIMQDVPAKKKKKKYSVHGGVVKGLQDEISLTSIFLKTYENIYIYKFGNIKDARR